MRYNTEWRTTKLQNMGTHHHVHISGRATAAAWGWLSDEGILVADISIIIIHEVHNYDAKSIPIASQWDFAEVVIDAE